MDHTFLRPASRALWVKWAAAVFGSAACASNARGGSMASAPLDASPDTNVACQLNETAVSVLVDGGTLYGTQAVPAPCPARAMACGLAYCKQHTVRSKPVVDVVPVLTAPGVQATL